MVRGLVRSRLFWVAGVLLAILLLYLALGVFGVQTLFYDTEVNEDFAVAGSRSGDRSVVSSGEFHAVAHPGTGEATVYRLGDGSYVLRLENLDILTGQPSTSTPSQLRTRATASR